MATTRPVLPQSFRTAGSGHSGGTGAPRPIIAKTDGQCLILKGVRFQDGKRYDIRIWRWDEDGNEIALNEHTKFSGPALAQIQALASNIFSYFKDPTKFKVIYRDDPETCESHMGSTIQDLIASGHTAIVDGARRIHQLLLPEARMDWSSDPRAKLVIQPQRITAEEIAAMNKANEEAKEAEEGVPQAKKPTDTSTGKADAAAETDPAEDTSAPSALPQPLSPQVERERLDKAATEFVNPPPFLKGVTYSDMVDYAAQPVKKDNDHLYHAYEAYKAVVANPALNDEKAQQMKAWLKWLYLNAYQLRKEQEEFRAYFDAVGSEVDYDEYCKLTAADSVISNVKVERMDIEPLKAELIQTPIPININIH